MFSNRAEMTLLYEGYAQKSNFDIPQMRHSCVTRPEKLFIAPINLLSPLRIISCQLVGSATQHLNVYCLFYNLRGYARKL